MGTSHTHTLSLSTNVLSIVRSWARAESIHSHGKMSRVYTAGSELSLPSASWTGPLSVRAAYYIYYCYY